MKHISLFSGIGGFDLAAQLMAWENVAHCEINEFCRRILKYYWPNAKSHEDIRTTDFTVYRGKIDILTGGFPCQPYSVAGKRKGTADDRHLWPEMLRAIREVSPKWIVGENVRGLVNWNGGLVFEQVQADLEAEGYEVLPFLLPAAGVGAPHRRDRIWFVAYAGGTGFRSDNRFSETGRTESENERTAQGENGQWVRENPWRIISEGPTPYAAGIRCERYVPSGEGVQRSKSARGEAGTSHSATRPNTHAGAPRLQERLQGEWFGDACSASIAAWSEPARAYSTGSWEQFPTQPPLCPRNDGLSARLDGITFPRWRNESIKGAGNAIVPQVVLQIFKAIEQYDQIRNKI